MLLKARSDQSHSTIDSNTDETTPLELEMEKGTGTNNHEAGRMKGTNESDLIQSAWTTKTNEIRASKGL